MSSGYFTTLGAELLRGRYFTDTEDLSKPRVVVINQALARQYFPSEDPIGKQIGDTSLSPKSIKEIIGIVDASGKARWTRKSGPLFIIRSTKILNSTLLLLFAHRRPSIRCFPRWQLLSIRLTAIL